MSKHVKGNASGGTHRKRIIALLLAGYLFGVIVGCVIIWAIPFTKNKADLLEIAGDKGEEVLSYGLKSPVMLYGMEHWLYNEEGRAISRETAFLHSSQWDKIREYVPDVLEKGTLFVPTLFLLDNRENDPTSVFGIVAGTIVESASGNRFVSILLRDMTDLDTTMYTYIALFSILYFVGVLFTIVTIKKERELNQMQRDLIANVSHELKTPITAIRAIAEVLHDGLLKDQETKHAYSKKLIDESDKLEHLVLDILELSKLQSNHTDFKKAHAYADGFIPPVVDRYMMLCSDMGITLDTSGLNLEDVPLLYTDAEKMVTLISIILDNAVKFTGKGGTIWISNQIHSKSTTFCIRDNGPGIHAKDMNRVFERFYKADIAHNSSGSGLGLAIADEIAKGLDEKLWVESSYGNGTSFYFTISC